MKRRVWTAVVMLALAAATGGCIDYQETIEVKPSGEIEVTIYATILEAALPMVRNRPELQQLLLLPTNAQATRALLPPSIKLKHWVIERGPGIRIYDVAITLPTMNAFENDFAPMLGDQQVQLFLDDDGNWHYRRNVAPLPFALPEGEARVFLRQRLADSNLSFELKVPTKVIETNGVRHGDKRVRWQTDLFELREKGILMVARVRPPGVDVRSLFAVGAAALVILLLAARRRRR